MENSFYGSLEHYSNEDFASLIDSKFGWSVKQQCEDILNGDLYKDQNEAALKYIAGFAKIKKEMELYESITNYLNEKEALYLEDSND